MEANTKFLVSAAGVSFGIYLAPSEQAARNACAMDAGYKSENDMENQLEESSDLVATPLDDTI